MYMFVMVTGGSGSGKSEFAENTVLSLYQKDTKAPFIYIATMKPFGQEAAQRIARHKAMRAEKHFETIECFTNLKEAPIAEGSVVLLDCMSNLVANEMYEEEGAKEEVIQAVSEGIYALKNKCRDLVIVTNEVFTDGCTYDESTVTYIERLGKVNEIMAGLADRVVEVVCGIPIKLKGEGECVC